MANEITSTNVAQAIVKLVAARAMPALLSNLVMGNLVNRDFEATVAAAGDTVNVPIPPSMTANNIAEAGSVVNQNPNLGNAQIVLNTHAEATFTIPDVTKVLAVPDLMATYMNPAIIAVAEKIEKDLLGLYPLYTANTPVGAGNTAITEATVDAAETALFKAKVSGQKFLVLSADAYSQLRRIRDSRRLRPTTTRRPSPAASSAPSKDSPPIGANWLPRLRRRPTIWPLAGTAWVWSSGNCRNPCPAPARWPNTPNSATSACAS